MRDWQVDLYSDTKTRPTASMRAAMAAAVVGDEQQDEDPTVAMLTRRVASMLGKDAGLFLPSGTMANLVSVLVHCQRGDEILCEASSHVLHYETGGPAGIAGVMTRPIVGDGGMFTIDELLQALRSPRRNAPRPRLVWVEQTTNFGGGRIDQCRAGCVQRPASHRSWQLQRVIQFQSEQNKAVKGSGAQSGVYHPAVHNARVRR